MDWGCGLIYKSLPLQQINTSKLNDKIRSLAMPPTITYCMEAFSDLMLLAAGQHHLSVPSKTCYKSLLKKKSVLSYQKMLAFKNVFIHCNAIHLGQSRVVTTTAHPNFKKLDGSDWWSKTKRRGQVDSFFYKMITIAETLAPN